MAEDADVLIVGTGAGGAACAYALAAAGKRVIALEAGPHYDYLRDYLLDKPTWEQQAFPEKVRTAGRQTVAPLQPLEAKWDELRSWNVVRGPRNTGATRAVEGGYKHTVAVGGTTLYFTGEYHRLNPASMRMQSRFGVAADWPVGYDELEPFYERAERLVGVSGAPFPAAQPRRSPYPLPPLPRSYATQVLAAGFDRRGLDFVPNPLAVLSRAYDGRPPCNYCGNCNRGCPRGDKGSSDITYLKHGLATGNLTIVPESPVLELERTGDRIGGVVAVDKDGARRRYEAPVVVLAAGAVETPRLLMNSGLAELSPHIGRHFMETLAWTSVGLHPDPLGSHRGHPSDAVCWDFNAPDAVDGVVGGFRISPGTAEANLVGPIHYAARVVGGFGLEHKRQMREQFGRALGLTAIGESLPNDDSRVDLDPDERDEHGLPKARLHSFLPDSELKRLQAMRRVCREVLEASGVQTLIEEAGSYDGFGASHVFGTCRMAQGPAEGVVDPFGKVFGLDNLYIADASVFPSSGGGESPSLTIAALALRTADHLGG